MEEPQLEVGRTAYWGVLLSLHEPEKARELLNAARQIFERLGAATDLQRVEEQLTLQDSQA